MIAFLDGVGALDAAAAAAGVTADEAEAKKAQPSFLFGPSQPIKPGSSLI